MSALTLLVEGVAGERYTVHVRTPRRLGAMPDGLQELPRDGEARNPADAESDAHRLELAFAGSAGEYVRREIVIPLL